LSFADAAKSLGSGSVTLAGSGAKAVSAAAKSLGIDAPATASDLLPDAMDMLFWAMEHKPTVHLHPLYLRPPDAKPPPPSFVSRSAI
jgi:tRNA threonylcarbamoyladenosine biosynthesis protein TsaB